MTLTKNKIAEDIQTSLDLPKNASADILEILLEIMKRTLESGEDIMISGYGKFCVNEKKERKGRNPATAEEMILPKRRVVTFKCSGRLKDKLNA